MTKAKSAAVPPLDGLRVVDLSTFTPGPFGTQILADLGATVLKVERPPHGDPERNSVLEYYQAYNRGKFSIALDTKQPEDLAVLLDLCRSADVFVEGFRPGATDRMGVGFGVVAEIQPKIIYVSIPGYPSNTAFAQDRGHDTEFQARSGAIAMMPRDRDGIPIYDSPYHVADYGAGMYAVIGILTALARPVEYAVHIEAPVFSAGLAWVFPKLYRTEFPESLNAALEQQGQDQGGGIGTFRTADGRYITLSAIEDRVWTSLCSVIGRADLCGPGLETLPERKLRSSELHAALTEIVLRRTAQDWDDLLRPHELSYAPVREPGEVLDDPAVSSARIIFAEPYPHAALPLTGLSSVRHVRAPDLDEHGDAVRQHGWGGLGKVGGLHD